MTAGQGGYLDSQGADILLIPHIEVVSRQVDGRSVIVGFPVIRGAKGDHTFLRFPGQVCLMGATADEVVADYMITYHNYYGVESGTEQYEIIARSNIMKSLATSFGLETIEGADLQACAEKYLLSIGLTQEEISAVQTALGE